MSSPMRKTRSSRAISSQRASRIASSMVTGLASSVFRTCSGFSRVVMVCSAVAMLRPAGIGGLEAGPWPRDRGTRDDFTKCGFSRRHRGRLRLGARRVDFAPDALRYRIQLGLRGVPLIEQRLMVAEHRVLRLPRLDLTGGNVRLGVVFRMPLATIRDHLQERGTFAP